MTAPTTYTPAQIFAEPERFGITWTVENVMFHDVQLTGPVVRITDLTAARQWLSDDSILGMADGSSYRVQNQAVVRRVVWDNRSATVETIVTAQILKMAGGRAPRTKGGPTFEAMDGATYADRTAMVAANLAHLVDNGVPLDQARTILGLTDAADE
jgi:hypothetical protein